MQTIRIGAAQVAIKKESDIDCHLKRVLRYIRIAGKKKCNFLCFPETYLYAELSRNIPQEKDIVPYLNEIKNECKKRSVWVIITSYVANGTRRYNRNYLINRQGKIVFKYDKVNLWPTERKLITPGKTNRVISTEFGRIVMITCYDSFFPEYIRSLSRNLVDVIFCPTFWVEYRTRKAKTIEVHETLGLIRAYESASYFVMCDPLYKRTIGKTYISSPFKIVSKITGREGLITAVINFNLLKEFTDYMNIQGKNIFDISKQDKEMPWWPK